MPDPNSLPSALAEQSELFQQMSHFKPVLFLDYDGTLTPIVNRPEDAILSDDMRNLLRQLASRTTVAIVSGRDRQDVKNFIRLDELIYAGSHGFDITGPNNMHMQLEEGKQALPELDDAEQRLEQELRDLPGTQVERKRFAIAVHYRNAAEKHVPRIKEVAEHMAESYPHLKQSGGKKIIELKPDIDWDKGRALLWLLENLGLDDSSSFPIYIGDDLTDEDAFHVLQDRGAGVLVGEHGKQSKAKYRLESVDEVEQFLGRILTLLEESAHE